MAYRRTHRKKQGKGLLSKARGLLRPGIKLFALVSILGIAAYLLHTPETTEPRHIRARQPKSATIPQVALRSTSLMPSESIQPEDQPVVGASQPRSAMELISGLPAVLDKASPEQANTADKLLSFITTGNMTEIRGLTSAEIQSLAELLTSELGAEAVATAVESYFGLPAASFLAQENPAASLTDLFAAVQSETAPTHADPVVFTDQVESDGSVTGNVHVIPAGTKRVYAAFENASALQDLDRVLAVWRNPSDDRMVFTEYEPVRTGSVYNYVWLELDDGWPAGFYQLDLFHPSKPSELLASRSFNVR